MPDADPFPVRSQAPETKRDRRDGRGIQRGRNVILRAQQWPFPTVSSGRQAIVGRYHHATEDRQFLSAASLNCIAAMLG